MMVEITCAECAKPFYVYPSQTTSIRGPRRYCSMSCRDESYAASPKPRCRWCGEVPKRRSFSFCSKPCKGAYQKTLKLPRVGPLVRQSNNEVQR